LVSICTKSVQYDENVSLSPTPIVVEDDNSRLADVAGVTPERPD